VRNINQRTIPNRLTKPRTSKRGSLRKERRIQAERTDSPVEYPDVQEVIFFEPDWVLRTIPAACVP
jgi:hypothetical protein